MEVPTLSKAVRDSVSVCAQAVIENFREKELGGRVFNCMTGSAPTAPEVADFLRDALIVPIYEGYGSTECGKPRLWCASGVLISLALIPRGLDSMERRLLPANIQDEIYYRRLVPEGGFSGSCLCR